MVDNSAFDAAQDPLGRHFPLGHERLLPILGIPVRFASNSAGVIEAVEALYGVWDGFTDPDPASKSRESIDVRLIVRSDGPRTGGAGISAQLVDEGRLLVSGAEATGIADVRRRDAVAYMGPDVAPDSRLFQDGIIATLTLFVLTGLDRLPLHAAGVGRDGSTVLLVGPSGAGKSTLAYAAGRAGLGVLGEDTVYVQRMPRVRLWGAGVAAVRLSEDAPAHFPELGGEPALPQASGKRKIVARIAARPLLVADRARICLLARSTGEPEATPLTTAQLRDAMRASLEPGLDRFADAQPPAIDPLLARGGWRLALSGDPARALPLIARMLDELEGA